jgi:hypothetical protein
MTIANGINKIVSAKIQSALGSPAIGSSAQIIRREQAKFDLEIGNFTNNEINDHQQSTGVTAGARKVNGSLNGPLSFNTYSKFMASVLRKQFAATTALTSTAVTIAGSGPYTITIGTGSFLTAGFKIGDVMRLSVGTLGAANINKNLLITGLTATVATVLVPNASTLTAEGPIAGCTLTVIGKKCIAPLASHTRDYWTFEEWSPDISQSEVTTDVMIGSFDIGLSNNANATFAMSAMGLNQTTASSQQHTSPTTATTTNIVNALTGVVMVGGVAVASITGASLKVDGTTAPLDPSIGAQGLSSDHSRGSIKVTGQFTAYFEDAVLPTLFNNATLTSVVFLAMDDSTAASDFISFSMSAVTITGASKDDGEKGVLRTYPFTAEINAAGGAALANDKTLLSIQDSLAA